MKVFCEILKTKKKLFWKYSFFLNFFKNSNLKIFKNGSKIWIFIFLYRKNFDYSIKFLFFFSNAFIFYDFHVFNIFCHNYFLWNFSFGHSCVNMNHHESGIRGLFQYIFSYIFSPPLDRTVAHNNRVFIFNLVFFKFTTWSEL